MSRILKFERRGDDARDVPNTRTVISGSVSMGSFASTADLHADPAVAVALAVRYGVMNDVTHTGVPIAVRDALRHHADHGSAAAQATIAWLDRQLLNAISATEGEQ